MIITKKFYTVFYLLLLQFLILNSIYAQSDFFASQTEGCTSFKVKFTPDFSAVDPDTIRSVKWHFGFGDTINSRNPDTVIFQREGRYTIVMVINNLKSAAIVKTDFIRVHRTVEAVFTSEEFAINYNYRFIPLDIISDPLASYTYTWTYENISRGTTDVNTHNVNFNNPSAAIDTFVLDTGIFNVTLTIEDNYGCVSRSEKNYTISDQVVIPNVFAPEIHHFFQIDPQDQTIVLLFKVFNRNGLTVFQQEAPVISWNGQTNSGIDLNTGVYYYILEAVEGDTSNRFSQKGFIHLYR